MIAANAVRTSGYLPWIEFGEFKFQSYFVIVSLVLCLAAFWIPRRALKLALPVKRALDIFIFAMIGGFLGSRLLHILWEEPAYYIESPMRVFDIMSGGFVWYGGFFGAVLAILGYLKTQRERDVLSWFDFFAPIAAFGYAGGRIACVLTGCCFGKLCLWPIGDDHYFFAPSQMFAVLWEAAACAFLLYLEKNQTRLLSRWGKRRLANGELFSLWLVMHGFGRIIMEGLRQDPRGPSLGPITISLVVSLALVASGTAFLVRKHAQTRV